MNLPLSTDDITFETFLQELPEDFRELAYEFKALCRSRKIKTPEDLLQVVMSYCGLDASLREVAGLFTLREERISDTAIHRRLQACVPWVKVLLGRLMSEGTEGVKEGSLRLVIVDGTTVQSPGATGTEYRVHVSLDLVSGQLLHAVVTDEQVGEHLDHAPLQEGDVVVVDRGYNQVRMWIDQADRGVSVVARYNPHGVRLYEADCDEALDIAQRLDEHPTHPLCLPVEVRDAQRRGYLKGFLHALPLPPDQAAMARRRTRAAAKQKGRQPQQRTLKLAGWVLIWTTLPPSLLSTETIMALYRVRWQVELAIKRLKSILDLKQLRARKDSVLADLYLHGKLLYAWVVEKRLRRRPSHSAQRLDQPRRATPWRAWTLMHRELTAAISEVHRWSQERWAEALEVMQERPRRRALQTVPERVRQLIADCRAWGVSNI